MEKVNREPAQHMPDMTSYGNGLQAHSMSLVSEGAGGHR